MDQKASPFAIAGVLQAVNAQTHITITLATAVMVVLVLFVTAFLLGLC